jgi:hypothetical protein
MEIIDRIHKVLIITEQNRFVIETMQTYEETEDKIIITCVEYVPQFKRGFVCNMSIEFDVYDTEKNGFTNLADYDSSNLVLVYIHKKAEAQNFTEFEYVFYK